MALAKKAAPKKAAAKAAPKAAAKAPAKAAAKAPAKAVAKAAAKTAAKTAATVTLKHLGAQLAEDFETPKKQTEAMLGSLVEQITKHLRFASAALAFCKSAPVRPGWAATRRRVRRSRSRPAKRWLSALPRS
jgi:hypothetical protein